MTRPVLAVLASRVRVEEKRIFAALERRHLPYRHVDTRRFGTQLPVSPEYRMALSREISQSRARYATRLLEAAGVLTVNRSEVIELCGDKLLTSLALADAGLPTPRTAVALTPEAAHAVIEEIGYPVVVKPLTGSWGRLLAVVRDAETAHTVLEHRAALPNPQQHIVYVQELVDKPDRDIRVVVTGDRVLGATYRCSADWRTNVARGGRSLPCPVTGELERLSLAAARAVGGGVLGVDLIEDAEGALHVLEVNHNVEFQGFQEAHGDAIDVAEAIVEHLGDGLAVAG
ncbi:MAG: lysine biosynthesis protein LysX [Actinocatenispora sp.]